jgi:sensor histidine kinase regulating citrate/malate metabolism
MIQQSQRMSLKWKIGGVYAGLMLLLGILAIGAVYQLTQNAVRDQLDRRALAIASNFSDAAAGHLASKNLLALNALARKYTLLDGTAYAFVEDGQREIVVHTFGSLPEVIRQRRSAGADQQVQRRQLALAGRDVYEVTLPILEGQLGMVHVGFWADAAQTEIRNTLVPIIGIMALVPMIGALLSFLLAHWIVRPIVGLTEIADKLTKGNLETSVSEEWLISYGEVGDLARSLERMRSSLKWAILRLSREAV